MSKLFSCLALFLCLMLCALQTALAETASVNLLDNGEEWRLSSWKKEGVIQPDDKTLFEGAPSMRLSSGVPNDMRAGLPVKVRAGRYYRFSAVIRTADVAGAVGANLSIYGTYNHSRRTLSGDNGWTRVEQVFRAVEDGEAEFALRLGYWNATATGTAWFAAPLLEELEHWDGDYQAILKQPADPKYASTPLRFFAFLIFVPFLYAYLALLRQQPLTALSAAMPPRGFAVKLAALLLLAAAARWMLADYMGYLPQLDYFRAWALHLAGKASGADAGLPYLAGLAGPLWFEWLGAAGAYAKAHMLETSALFTLLLKLPLIAAELALMLLALLPLARRLPPRQFWWQACFWLFNPAMLMVTAFLGLPLALAALGVAILLLLWLRGRLLLAGIAFGFALASHWLVLVLLPVLLYAALRKPAWRGAGRFMLAAAASALLFHLPSQEMLFAATPDTLPYFMRDAVVPAYSLAAWLPGAAWFWGSAALFALIAVMRRCRIENEEERLFHLLFMASLLAALLLPLGQELMLYLGLLFLLPLLPFRPYYRGAYLLVTLLLFARLTLIFTTEVLQVGTAPAAAVMDWLLPVILFVLLLAGLGMRLPGLARLRSWGDALLRPREDSGTSQNLFKLSRWDYLALLLLWCGALALVFFNIGERHYPTHGSTLTAPADSFEVDLGTPQRVKQVRLYTGANGSGTVRFEVWDGARWQPLWREEAGRLRYVGSAEYRSTFKLLRKTLKGERPLQRLRITLEGDGFDVTELALMGADESPIVPAQIITADGALAAAQHPLFDEQARLTAEYGHRAKTIWDEVFYARSAYELVQGEPPYEKSHPPLGKSIIGIGIRLFDMTPFGWRAMDALFVSLLPLLLFMGGRWLTGRRTGAYLAAVLAIFETMFYLHGRWANIDTFLVLFVTASLLAFYRWYMLGNGRIGRDNAGWFIAGGICFGLAVSTKWSALFTGFAIFVLFVIAKGFELARAHREALAARQPLRRYWVKEVLPNAAGWAFAIILLPLLVYYFSHAEFVRTAAGQPGILTLAGFQAFVEQQLYVWGFHSGKEDSHSASSFFLTWPLMWKPVSIFSAGGAGEAMRASMTILGNPLIWWPGLLAMLWLGWRALAGQDKAAVFLVGIYFIQCLPWLLVSRTSFLYGYYPFIPWLILAIAYAAVRLDYRKTWPKLFLLSYLVGVIAVFAAYYPLVNAIAVPLDYVDRLRLLPAWSVL